MNIVTRIEKMPHPPAPEEKTLQFRNAMSRHAAAVSIVTTDGPGGRAGFAATAVCSVTDSPPTLLVCINRASSAYPAVSENGVLCINTLDERHEPVSRVFGGKTPMAERFDSATWTTMATGSPALDGALVSFDCRVARIADGGTHDILICEVDAMRLSEDGRSLVYFDRAYHRI